MATSSIDTFLEALGHRAEGVRSEAVENLIDAYVAESEAGRTRVSEAVRGRCLEVAARRSGGLNLADSLMRFEPLAIEALAAMQGSDRSDSMVRDGCAMRLGSMAAQHAEVLATVGALLEHGAEEVRGGAVAGLVESRASGADIRRFGARLLELARDPATPSKAQWLLGFVCARLASDTPEDGEEAARVRELLGSELRQPIRGALNALARKPTSAAGHLREAIAPHCRAKSKPLRKDAWCALVFGHLAEGDDAAVRKALEGAKLARIQTHYALRLAAKSIDISAFLGHLAPSLTSEDGFLRWTAVATFANAAERGAELGEYTEVLRTMAQRDADERCRTEAARAIAMA